MTVPRNLWTDDELVILVPVLRRPHRVAPLLDSITATVPGAQVLFVATADDADELAALDAAGAEYITVPPEREGYAPKINAGYRATDRALLFLGADDLRFHPGWFAHASARIQGRVGVVGVNDLGNPRVMRGKHATQFLIARSYVDQHGTIDQPGLVLHEGYRHNFVDDELLATARRRGAVAMALRSHVEHLHPNWKKSVRDTVYDLGQASFEADREVYNSRRHLWGQAHAR
jgi:hypothetical protein